jgi:hypothetical protein
MKRLESNEGPPREHLLISYASEDWVFADWLALKLASEGYEVWYDRLKLLGGESYPRDTTKAIRNQTFRVIALLSRNSIAKLDPVKERTLALNIAKERNIDFLIPLSLLPAYRRNPPRANAHKRLSRAFATRHLIMSSSLRSITAVFHVAPPATAIPTHIHEQPATVLSLALADSVQLIGGQQLRC